MRRVLVEVVDARLPRCVEFGCVLEFFGELGVMRGVCAQWADRDLLGFPGGLGDAVLGPAELKDGPRVEDQELEKLVARGALRLRLTGDVPLIGERQERRRNFV